MDFEFHGISALKEDSHKITVPKTGPRFLPSQPPSPRTKKKQRKHSRQTKKLRRAVEKLATTVDTMQAEIEYLKNYDRDGFYVLRRKRVK